MSISRPEECTDGLLFAFNQTENLEVYADDLDFRAEGLELMPVISMFVPTPWNSCRERREPQSDVCGGVDRFSCCEAGVSARKPRISCCPSKVFEATLV